MRGTLADGGGGIRIWDAGDQRIGEGVVEEMQAWLQRGMRALSTARHDLTRQASVMTENCRFQLTFAVRIAGELGKTSRTQLAVRLNKPTLRPRTNQTTKALIDGDPFCDRKNSYRSFPLLMTVEIRNKRTSNTQIIAQVRNCPEA